MMMVLRGQLLKKESRKRLKENLKVVIKNNAELNRSIANEWLALDFEGLLKYENIIYDDFGYDFYRIEESRIAESGESDTTKSKS